MHTGGQEIRHMLRRKEFCHHAAETMLEVRSVHCFWMEVAVTVSLGFSYLWKISYKEGETQQNSLMALEKMESSFQNSLS